MIYPKFIIETDDELGDCLILSEVSYHRDIANNIYKVKGGGLFIFDDKAKTFTLYGESFEFGKASPEDIEKCIEKKLIFTNNSLTDSIADKYKFIYRLIYLKRL